MYHVFQEKRLLLGQNLSRSLREASLLVPETLAIDFQDEIFAETARTSDKTKISSRKIWRKKGVSSPCKASFALHSASHKNSKNNTEERARNEGAKPPENYGEGTCGDTDLSWRKTYPKHRAKETLEDSGMLWGILSKSAQKAFHGYPSLFMRLISPQGLCFSPFCSAVMPQNNTKISPEIPNQEHPQSHFQDKKTVMPQPKTPPEGPWLEARSMSMSVNHGPLAGWRVVFCISPEHAYGAFLHEISWQMMGYFLKNLLLCVALLLIVRRFLHHISIAHQSLSAYAQGRYPQPPKGPFLFQEIANLSQVTTRLGQNLRTLRSLSPITLLTHDNDLGGVEKKCQASILFGGPWDFSKIVRSMPATSVFRYCSIYFQEITHIIRQKRGHLDKYMGPGLMAFWGPEKPDVQDPVNMCLAALQACALIDDQLMPKLRRENAPALRMHFGLASGYILAGNVGNGDFKSYTLLGDAVNRASRLQDMAASYGVRILVDGATYDASVHALAFRPVDRITLYGIQGPVTLYELLPPYDGPLTIFPGDKFSENVDGVGGPGHGFTSRYDYMQWIVCYHQAYACYVRGDFHQALGYYAQLLQQNPRDSVAKLLVQKCQTALSTPKVGAAPKKIKKTRSAL